MPHPNSILTDLLQAIDLGSSVAESDTLLEVARIETSAFIDILNDRVDLIPGTKGSGKTALFRIFVDFLPDLLLRHRKVVVAHGVQNPGDPVFNAFKNQFSKLTEHDFVSFWCIYLVSLAHEQFIKGARYADLLKGAAGEVEAFREACAAAGIPEIKARKSLKEVLQWTLHVLSAWRPKVTYRSPDGSGELEFDLFGKRAEPPSSSQALVEQNTLPKYANDVKDSLKRILQGTDLSLWLMIDRLDEIFPRRSKLERRALRGLLRSMRFFSSPDIRIKVFLRDDMLDQVVRGDDGFTALTHITVRQADTLRWNEGQILSMVVKRLFATTRLAIHLKINTERLDASADYRKECFYKVFPPTIHKGPKQSTTLRWIYNRCADGRGVVTPRDVIDLLSRAKQRQHDECAANAEGSSNWIIGTSALQYGLQELSKRKRQTYLRAEFPDMWKHIKRFVRGKTEYDQATIQNILGKGWKPIADDLVSIGLFSRRSKDKRVVYWVPFLYRYGLEMTQGRA